MMCDTNSQEFQTINNVCFICNHVFLDAEEQWSLFNKQISEDGTSEFSISHMLCKILQIEIIEDAVHSKFLCEICNANILEFESLERRLMQLKQNIKANYEQNIQSLEQQYYYQVEVHEIDGIEGDLPEYTKLENNLEEPAAAPEVLAYELDDIGTYRCCLCRNAETFPTLNLVVSHLRASHMEHIHACMLCDEVFVQKQQLNTHIETLHVDSHEIAGYECEPCNMTFRDLQQFREHRFTKHSSVSTQTTAKRPYECDKCGKGFATRHTLQAHAKIHTKRARPFNCKQCDKNFINEKNLVYHMKSHVNDKPYICTICGKAFKSQHNLDMHNIVHTKMRPHACGTCGKSFARRSEVIDHERIHTGERPFKCDLCNLAFNQRANLSSHKKSTHFNEKLHKCEQCDRAFKRKRLLDYHIQAVHTGERPHKCDVCGMGFVYPEHYKKHLLIHTGLKPYACEVCGKQFKSRDNRNAHRFVHSDKKPYECLQCGAGFMRKPLLLQHMNNNAHATDTIIINQPQISEPYLKSGDNSDAIVNETVIAENLINVLELPPENVENATIISGDFEAGVEYLQFDDFVNDEGVKKLFDNAITNLTE